MKLLSKLQHSVDFWFLLGISFLFFLFRLPSFFEPYWYGDEGVYEVLGFAMRHGRMLYQGIWDNKPPLLYLIYSLVDGNQMYAKILSCFFGIGALVVLYFLTKRLCASQKSVYTTTGIFAILFGLPLIEGNIANAENFMLFPIFLAIFLIVKTIQDKKYFLSSLFISGILLGLAFLIKVVAVFDFATILLLIGILLLQEKKTNFVSLVQKLFTVSFAFIIPFLLTVGFFVSKGMLKTFIQSAFLSNVGYVNYGNQFIIPQGFLILKLLILFIIIFVVFLKRKSLSLLELLVYLWLPFCVFNAFFSGRPYTHYVLTLLGAVCLLIGMLFEKKHFMFNVIVVIAVIALVGWNFEFYNKTLGYYQNFLQYLSGQKTVASYQAFFDKGVPRDYAVVDYLETVLKPNESAFLWTNSAQMYYLLQQLPPGRYTTAYHITLSQITLEETALSLQKTQPTFLAILPNASTFPFRVKNYRLVASIDTALIYEKVF